jgi:hypothetical protein
MGEAKRKAKMTGARTWATGKIRVEANDELCFEWIGTQQEAIEQNKRYLDAVSRVSAVSAEAYAKRAAGYLMCFGMPEAGDPDLRPSFLGEVWRAGDVELYRLAVLWSVMREHIPNTGQKIEDVFVGKSLMVAFIGDKTQIIANTEEELKGLPFSGEEYSMTVAVLDDHRLNPDDALGVKMADLCAIMGRPALPEDLPNELVYVPRIPLDAAEAEPTSMPQHMRMSLEAKLRLGPSTLNHPSKARSGEWRTAFRGEYKR